MQSGGNGFYKMSSPFSSGVTGRVFSSLMENGSWRWLGACLSLLLFIAVISLSYSLGVRDIEKGAVPIIVSDGSAVKVRPENPGGKQFPYQDMTIYQNLRGKNEVGNITLTNDPEKPAQYSPAEKMALDNAEESQILMAPLQNEDIGQDDGATQDVSMPEKLMKPKIEKIEAPKLSETILPKKQDVVVPKAVITPQQPKADDTITQIIRENIKDKKTDVVALEVKKTEAPLPTPKTTGQAGAFLQVGAYRSEAEALKAWQKISSSMGGLLGTSSHVIVKADLQGKGTYYRLRVGPYGEKRNAISACEKLKARSQGCMFVAQ